MKKDNKTLSGRHKRYNEKREAILKSAIKKFSSKGYALTSIEEIAKGAQFGKGSIYHYFTSKEEILDAIISQKTEELLNLIKFVSVSDLPPLFKLEKLITTLMIFLHDNLEYFNIIMQHFVPFQSSTSSSSGPAYKKFQSFYETQNLLIGDILRQAQQTECILPMDIHETAAILTGMINYSILYWIKNRPSKDFVEWMSFGKHQEDQMVDYFPKRVQSLIRIFFSGIKSSNNASDALFENLP